MSDALTLTDAKQAPIVRRALVKARTDNTAASVVVFAGIIGAECISGQWHVWQRATPGDIWGPARNVGYDLTVAVETITKAAQGR